MMLVRLLILLVTWHSLTQTDSVCPCQLFLPCNGYPPRNVSDTVRAVVYDWSRLTLTFDAGKYHRNDTVVNVTWTCIGADSWYYCDNSTDSQCIISNFKQSPKYFFNITVANLRAHEEVLTSVSFIVNEIVKVVPVTNLRHTSASRSITLSWDHKDTRNITFRVVSKLNGTEIRNQIIDTTDVFIEGLHPNTDYDFVVTAKFPESRYWSDERTHNAATTVTNPGYGANITLGGFYSSTSCFVLLYVKEPDPIYQNGPLLRYTFNIVPSSGEPTNITSDIETTYRFELECDTSYDVNISAWNEAGPSPPTSLHIPAAGSVATLSSVSVEMNGFVNVSWEVYDEVSPINWTVMWCIHSKEVSKYLHCESDLDWIIVDGSKRSTIVPLNESQITQRFMFGVSMMTNLGSSGLRWHDCLYSVSKDPNDLERPAIVSVEQKPNLGLTVNWILDRCPQQTLITHYIIQHCPVGSTKCVTDTIPSLQSDYVVTDLKAKTNYSIKIQQVAISGRGGKLSEPVFGVPIDTRLTTGEITGIVFGSILALVIVISFFVFCSRCTLKKIKQREEISFPQFPKDADYPPKPPDRPESFTKVAGNMTDRVRHVSDDSGHHSPPESPAGEVDHQEALQDSSSAPASRSKESNSLTDYSKVDFKSNSGGKATGKMGLPSLHIPEPTVAFASGPSYNCDFPESSEANSGGRANNGFESDTSDSDDEDDDAPYIKNEASKHMSQEEWSRDDTKESRSFTDRESTESHETNTSDLSDTYL